MSKPVLYSIDVSPPCRAVLMTAELIGVKFDIRKVDLLKKEHLAEEFRKINPQHMVPALDDNGFIVWDSHAIMGYLVNKYASNDSLYPKDPQMRAHVDQYLHFDSNMLFLALKSSMKPLLLDGATSISKEKMDLIAQAYEYLNKFLEGKKWLVGNSYTIADIGCVASLTGLTAIKPLDGYPNIQAWLKTCEQEIPVYQKINVPGNNELHEMYKTKVQ